MHIVACTNYPSHRRKGALQSTEQRDDTTGDTSPSTRTNPHHFCIEKLQPIFTATTNDAIAKYGTKNARRCVDRSAFLIFHACVRSPSVCTCKADCKTKLCVHKSHSHREQCNRSPFHRHSHLYLFRCCCCCCMTRFFVSFRRNIRGVLCISFAFILEYDCDASRKWKRDKWQSAPIA